MDWIRTIGNFIDRVASQQQRTNDKLDKIITLLENMATIKDCDNCKHASINAGDYPCVKCGSNSRWEPAEGSQG